MYKSFRFRIYPNKQQKELLNKTFGCTRFIWNQMLSYKKSYYKENKKSIRITPTGFKKTYEWLKEVDSLSLSNTQLQLEQAYRNFFRDKKIGFPNYKSKHSSKNAYTTSNIHNNVKLLRGYIKLPKLTPIRIKQHREIPRLYKVKSVTVSKTLSDKYYVSILTEYEKIYEEDKRDINKTIGIDMSLNDFIVTSDGVKAKHPRWYRKSEKTLRIRQKSLSRKQKGSNNRLKQKKVITSLHEKIANKRKDYIEKLTKQLINQYDYFVLEDIDLRSMKKSLNLGKSISDLGFGIFKIRLEQKANEEGKLIIKISKWFPSSKLCSFCGWKNNELELSDRDWTCKQCGKKHDRDINAAVNLKNEFISTVGVTGFQACGEGSSGLPKKVNETTVKEARSPHL